MKVLAETDIKIARLLIELNKVEEIGLLNGKMGLSIYFFQLARTHRQEEYERYASGLLDEVANSLSMQMPIDFATGLTGIGWGIEYLIQNQFVEGDADEILEEVDTAIFNFFISNQQTIETVTSIARYYIARLNYRIKAEENETVLSLKYNVILLIDELGRLLNGKEQVEEVSYLIDELYKLNIFNFKLLKLKRKLQKSTKHEFADLTIIIPVRIDCKERLCNLMILLRQLSVMEGLKIIILEADLISKIQLPDYVRKVFVEDSDPIFHRTKYINILCGLTETEYIGIWDTDVIIPLTQIKEALATLRKKEVDMIYPYDGRFYNVTGNILEEYQKLEKTETLLRSMDKLSIMYGHHSCGGAFMVNKKAYKEAGGENEKFYGWGPEDLERYKRWEIKGYKVVHTQGPLFHLDHPRGENSRYYNKESQKTMFKALLETCRGETNIDR